MSTHPEHLEDGIFYKPQALNAYAEVIMAEIERMVAQSPYRVMHTQRGHAMSAEITNCGALGWVSDRKGYRYSATDPLHGRPWPAMPTLFRDLANQFATEAGYTDFVPDVCLMNRYAPHAKMGLHQDKDEVDFTAPIVSFSLGLPAMMVWSHEKRGPVTRKLPLMHGDVLVFGGSARLFYHGISPIPEGHHVELGPYRYNLTFRQTGLGLPLQTTL